ncbi:MAG: hypothetical protein ACRD3O_00740 [Terriglobia bacterium]
MFARKIKVEVIEADGSRDCPLSWLDSFSMRSFTGRTAFDETLPIGDGRLEASFRVDLEALQRDMEDWMTLKFGGGSRITLRFTPHP